MAEIRNGALKGSYRLLNACILLDTSPDFLNLIFAETLKEGTL